MRQLKFGIFALLFVLAVQTAYSQSFYARRMDKKFSVQAGAAITSFYGETREPGSFFNTPKVGFDVGLQYHFHNHFAARSNVRYFNLKGSDENVAPLEEGGSGRYERNLSFNSFNFQWTVEGMALLFPENSRYYQRSIFNAYAVAGIGLMYYNPTAIAPDTYNGVPLEQGGQRTSLRKLQTEGQSYSPITFTYQAGIGLELEITKDLDIMVEGLYNFTTTDYIDDVSNRYAGQDFFDDPLAAAMSDRGPELGFQPKGPNARRGNPENNDGFFILMVKADYWLPQGGSSRKRGPKRRAPSRRRR